MLINALAQRRLIDTYVLMIHPLILGSGRRLFDNVGTAAELRLVNSTTTSKGVVIATYDAPQGTSASKGSETRERASVS
ncbi:MAG: dihydrofolate reductase family protein [Actinomycetota bacterium]|nr:dihydrofolate reductase family protein [Actinomycetota bacterium]